MRILVDLQPLQTPGAVTRGVGKYTNGLLGALAASHEVIGMRRAGPFLIPPTVNVAAIEVNHDVSEAKFEREVSDRRLDAVVNCSGPYWEENVIVSGFRNPDRPIVASIFYDVIPWVFPDVYLSDPVRRQSYHNRCVDLYSRADLVCGISGHSSSDARRFGYATDETATTISTGVVPLVPEGTNARKKWNIPRPYLLSVSGDEFRKNPERLIPAYLQSNLREPRWLVIVISNDAQGAFSSRMRAKYGDLRTQGVVILPEVTESELGALYRDSDAFVFTSSYEGFGIPLVEAMQFGKWIVSPLNSSMAEVSGATLLSSIGDPGDIQSIVSALNQAAWRLSQGPLDEAVPRNQAKKFTWEQVRRNFEEAVRLRREAIRVKPEPEKARRPRRFWASPLPADVSGIAFYSEDLVGAVSRRYDIVLVPNTISTFVPTHKTGRFKIVEPRVPAILAMSGSEPPLIFYNIGNSHFHLELIDLLFKIPGIVLLHDSFVGGLEGLWRDRISGLTTGQGLSSVKPTGVLDRWFRVLGKMDRLLHHVQPTRFRRILSGIAGLPGIRPMVLTGARVFRGLSALGGVSQAQTDRPRPTAQPSRRADRGWRSGREERPKFDGRPLDVQIIESSRAMIFLCDHAKSLIAPEYLAMRPTHVVPLYARYRGTISAEKKAELRRKYAIPEDSFVVTTTGFLATIKLTDRVIRGCMEFERFETNGKVYAQVLGQFVDRNFEAEVRALVEKSGVRVFLSDGFVTEETLTERVALSDVAVFLRSWSTGAASAALNDALGMGIPCLVTDDFAFREYPKTTVLRVANTEVTEGLMLLYRHPAVRESLAAGGLRYAQDLSVERVCAKLCEVLSRYEEEAIIAGKETSGVRVGQATAHVFVDVTYGLMQKVRSGLQRVEREIASGLRELDPGARYFSYVAWDKNSRQFRLVSLEHLKKRDSLPPLETWLAVCPAAAIGDGAHLFTLSFNWPLGETYFVDLLELARRGVQLSVFLPDLIPLRYRWTFYAHHPEGSGIDQFKAFCLQVVPMCRNVLTISNYSAADIQKMLVEIGGATAEKKDVPKMHVLKLGAGWTTPFVDAPIAGASTSSRRIAKNPYVLYVSSLDIRKNHQRLVEAFIQVRQQVNNLDLVLVGRVDGSIPAATLEFIRRSPWIHHFEGIEDTTVVQLYEDCLFTVFPSLDEGYGLPVIESFLYGKFCLAANAGAIPEAGGIFADYFDPYDVRMLAEKILTYVTNPLELEKRVALLRSYRPTSWRSTARKVAEIFYGDAVVDMPGAREEG